jgi:hypothetical protein
MQEEAQQERAQGELRLNLHETTERINTLEESRLFCSKKYEELMADGEQRYGYSYEAEILYNPAYNSANAMREVCRAVLQAVERLLVENYSIKTGNE